MEKNKVAAAPERRLFPVCGVRTAEVSKGQRSGLIPSLTVSTRKSGFSCGSKCSFEFPECAAVVLALPQIICSGAPDIPQPEPSQPPSRTELPPFPNLLSFLLRLLLCFGTCLSYFFQPKLPTLMTRGPNSGSPKKLFQFL